MGLEKIKKLNDRVKLNFYHRMLNNELTKKIWTSNEEDDEQVELKKDNGGKSGLERIRDKYEDAVGEIRPILPVERNVWDTTNDRVGETSSSSEGSSDDEDESDSDTETRPLREEIRAILNHIESEFTSIKISDKVVEITKCLSGENRTKLAELVKCDF
jgi:hypothetical protein